MRVLLSSCVHWWNAEAAYAAVLAEELLGAGHQAMVWTQPGTANEAELLRRGLPLITTIPPAGKNPLRWPATLAGLADLQRRERIEIVDVFRSAEFPLHLLAARHAPEPRVVRTRGSARPVGGGWLNRKMYGEWGAGLIAASGVVCSQMGSALHLPQERIHTIYYPIDLPAVQSPAEWRKGRRDFLGQQGLPEDGFVMGIVGRLYPEKGHQRLLEAMESLVRRVPQALLVIFAKASAGEDPERPALEKGVRAAGLDAHVRFTGYREDIRRAMGWLDVGVIPSLASEVNCRVAVEFFSVGTPVVAFPTGALPEVVEHGVSGMVMQDHGPQGLAQALEQLARDPAQRKRLGNGARRQAEKRFSRGRFLDQTLEVFQAALDGKSR